MIATARNWTTVTHAAGDRRRGPRCAITSVLDVFTNVPLEGNQLAVFTDAAGIDDDLMQRTARELNLSETVFMFAGDRECDARIRIFTPGAELPFAGHPVLGTAFVVGERLGCDQVRLRTGRGVVRIALERREGVVVFGEMEQPIPTVSSLRART